MDKDTSTLIIN